MSSAVLNAHIACGSPCGDDATFDEIVEWAGDLILSTSQQAFPCSTCGGTGGDYKYDSLVECGWCNGSGVASTHKETNPASWLLIARRGLAKLEADIKAHQHDLALRTCMEVCKLHGVPTAVVTAYGDHTTVCLKILGVPYAQRAAIQKGCWPALRACPGFASHIHSISVGMTAADIQD